MPVHAGLIEQSPIDIVTADVVQDPSFRPLSFQYAASTTLTVLNVDAPSVEGTIRGIPAPGSTLSYDGSVYNLLQFHFHIDSEHEIDGRRFPMEMHFVNQKVGSTGTDDLLVVGRFVEVGDTNAVLVPFFDAIASIPNPGDSLGLTAFDIASLVPLGQPQYRYAGSLTTPPYTEGVNWNIFYGPSLAVSAAQIDQFAAAFPFGDSRDVQPLHGRLVTTAVPEVNGSAAGAAIAALAAVLALFERHAASGRRGGHGRQVAT